MTYVSRIFSVFSRSYGLMDEPDPTRIVADTDVLAADLFIGGAAREALDLVRSHSWLTLVATQDLLEEAERVITTLGNQDLGRVWRSRMDEEVELITSVASGHSGLVAAASADAATVLSFDEHLQSAAAGVTIRSRVATSVKSPAAFISIVDPATLHETLFDRPYPGRDRDPHH